MTNKEAIEIFEKYLKCAEETCCIMDCFNCDYDVDDNQIYRAIEVVIKALKTTGEDLIRRQDAIDAVLGAIYDDEYWKEQVERAINTLPSAQPEQQWISCSERLPKLGIRYNVTYESGEVGYADFRNKVIYVDKCIENVWDIPEYYEDDGQVVAWMPLPEPYRENKK